MRKPIIAGNWKMHGTRTSVQNLLEDIVVGSKTFTSHVDLIVFPSFVFLEQTERVLRDSVVQWGAQNVNATKEGAFTGEISASMLTDFGCRYVLVGHSERRTLYAESDAMVIEKMVAAHQAHLKPILCVGESLKERETKQTFAVLERQLAPLLKRQDALTLLNNSVIAYEPVWAIGTGLTATPSQAQEAHEFIRLQISKLDKGVARQLRILYGGSVKPDNANALFSMSDIDGGLIGGASLQAQSFLAIAESCKV